MSPRTRLPRSHSGYEHVEQTGHRLAISTRAYSNCAECDWVSDSGSTVEPG